MCAQESSQAQNLSGDGSNQLKHLDGESLMLDAGARVLLEPVGSGRKFWAEFIGMKRGRFIILQPPMSLEMRDLLRPDDEVTVRFAHKAYQVCGFKAWITRFLLQPAHLVFISYPPSYETLSMRRHARCASVLPVVMRCARGEVNGVIVNLSGGGCRVALKLVQDATAVVPEKDEEVFLSFAITGDLQEVHAKGVVRSKVLEKNRLSVGECSLPICP